MIDLKPFLHTTKTQYTMTEPIVRSGWRYATDGRICIRIKCNGEADTPETHPPAPPCRYLFGLWSKVKISAWHPWPGGLVLPEHEECGACDGSGKWGKLPCEVCAGEGKKLNGRPFTLIDGRNIAAKYHNLIVALPKPEYAEQGEKMLNRPLLFRFKGGEGIVMGVAPVGDVSPAL